MHVSYCDSTKTKEEDNCLEMKTIGREKRGDLVEEGGKKGVTYPPVMISLFDKKLTRVKMGTFFPEVADNLILTSRSYFQTPFRRGAKLPLKHAGHGHDSLRVHARLDPLLPPGHVGDFHAPQVHPRGVQGGGLPLLQVGHRLQPPSSTSSCPEASEKTPGWSFTSKGNQQLVNKLLFST